MEILIYDNQLNRIGAIDNYNLIWNRKYYEPGDFELTTFLDSKNRNLLKNGNIIAKEDSVEAAIIEDVRFEDNTKKLTVKGRFLSSLLDRRLIKQTYSFKGNAEEAMRNLINYCVQIPLVELGKLNGYSEKIEFQATMKGLLSIETKIAKSSGLGFRIKPDFYTKKLIFEVYRGIDRTKSQSFNDRVIFSESYDNLNNLIYQFNDQLSKSFAVVGGKGEGSNRVYVEVGNGSGLNLREIFIDAKDIDDTKYSNNAEYLNALKQRGLEKLNGMKSNESYEYETSPIGNFNYKQHYDLGDLVTIEKREWGVSLVQRITEISEVYENGGMTIIPTLGNPISESVDWSNL